MTKVFVAVHHDVKRSIMCVSTYENCSRESDVQVVQAEEWHLLLLFKKSCSGFDCTYAVAHSCLLGIIPGISATFVSDCCTSWIGHA